MQFVELLALVTASLFSGAAFYINFAEHPARLKLDDRNLLAQWRPSYSRGFIMQASLAVVSALLGFAAAWASLDWRWAIGGALILSNWPYTLLVMLPTNNKLYAGTLEHAAPSARPLMLAWGRLHAMRTVLGIAAAAIYLWAALA